MPFEVSDAASNRMSGDGVKQVVTPKLSAKTTVVEITEAAAVAWRWQVLGTCAFCPGGGFCWQFPQLLGPRRGAFFPGVRSAHWALDPVCCRGGREKPAWIVFHCNPRAAPCGASARADGGGWSGFRRRH